MSNAWLNRVNQTNHYKGAARAVLLVLADMADKDGVCWPSASTIARRAGCERRTVQRAMRELEQGPEIRVVIERRRVEESVNLSNVYQLILARGDDAESPVETQSHQDDDVESSGVVTLRHQDDDVESPKSSFNPQLNHQLIVDFKERFSKMLQGGTLREAWSSTDISADENGQVTIVCATDYDRLLLEERLTNSIRRELIGIMDCKGLVWDVNTLP